jgi:hypothetical protein
LSAPSPQEAVAESFAMLDSALERLVDARQHNIFKARGGQIQVFQSTLYSDRFVHTIDCMLLAG